MVLLVVRDWRKGLLLRSFPLVYFATTGSIDNVFLRYAVPFVPFLCLGAGVVIDVVAGRLTTPSSRLGTVVAGVLALAVVAPSAWSGVAAAERHPA